MGGARDETFGTYAPVRREKGGMGGTAPGFAARDDVRHYSADPTLTGRCRRMEQYQVSTGNFEFAVKQW
jgi:hypothetical protein